MKSTILDIVLENGDNLELSIMALNFGDYTIGITTDGEGSYQFFKNAGDYVLESLAPEHYLKPKPTEKANPKTRQTLNFFKSHDLSGLSEILDFNRVYIAESEHAPDGRTDTKITLIDETGQPETEALTPEQKSNYEERILHLFLGGTYGLFSLLSMVDPAFTPEDQSVFCGMLKTFHEMEEYRTHEPVEFENTKKLLEMIDGRTDKEKSEMTPDFIGAFNDMGRAIDKLFEIKLKNYEMSIEESIDILPKALPQKEYLKPTYHLKITEKSLTTIFRTSYTKENLKDGFIQPVKVAPRKDKNLINMFEVNAMENNLTELHLMVCEAYWTEKQVNPKEPGITFLDIANDLYRSKTGKPLKSHHQLVREVRKCAEDLLGTPFKLDFNKKIDMVLDDPGKSKRIREAKKRWQNYRANGGKGIIQTRYIPAEIIPIRKRNGTVLDGLSFNTSTLDNVFFEYLELTKELKRIPEPLLTNPLSAKSTDNVVLYRYLAYKLSQLPYSNKNKKLIDLRLHILDLKKELGKEVYSTDEYTKALKQQENSKIKDRTIRADTIIKDLKLENRSSNKIKTKMEEIFKYWQSIGIIHKYSINYASNNRTKESYTINFF